MTAAEALEEKLVVPDAAELVTATAKIGRAHV